MSTPKSRRLVSFDFDTTLYQEVTDPVTYYTLRNKINPLAEKMWNWHEQQGDDIIIVTSRLDHPETVSDILVFLREYDLQPKGIYMTSGNSKTETLVHLGVNIHYDDDKWEIYSLGVPSKTERPDTGSIIGVWITNFKTPQQIIKHIQDEEKILNIKH